MEREDDIEFQPHLDFLGQPQMLVAPVELGGKLRAKCRQPGHILDPAGLKLHTAAPVFSLLAEVRPVISLCTYPASPPSTAVSSGSGAGNIPWMAVETPGKKQASRFPAVEHLHPSLW